MPSTAAEHGGRPLVLLPGMLCDERSWADTARALHGDREVVHLPLAGSSVDAAVQAVLALPVPRFDLAGLSLGGIVAMHVAVRAPERVGRLVLLSTSARAPRPDQLAGWSAAQTRALSGDLSGVAGDLLPVLLRPQAQQDPDLRRTVLDMARDTGVPAFLAQLDLQRSRTPLLERLGRLRVPALVVSAEQDALCPPELLREIAEALPVSRLVALPDCGHLSTLERPGEVAELLRDWLATPTEQLEPAGAGSSR